MFFVESEDGKDDACEACPENGCNVCVSRTECKVEEGCKEGFSLISEKRLCLKCSDKCLECESSDKCTKCQPGFFVGEADSCEECLKAIPLCEECSNGMNCTKCSGSMEYIDGKCQDTTSGSKFIIWLLLSILGIAVIFGICSAMRARKTTAQRI